jgi:hypothetical protein
MGLICATHAGNKLTSAPELKPKRALYATSEDGEEDGSHRVSVRMAERERAARRTVKRPSVSER